MSRINNSSADAEKSDCCGSSRSTGDCGLNWRRRPLSYMLVAIVRLYQLTLSRWMGGHCKFMPTCSEYFIQAIVARGVFRGTLKGLWRICRCNPFSRGGYDPPV